MGSIVLEKIAFKNPLFEAIYLKKYLDNGTEVLKKCVKILF